MKNMTVVILENKEVYGKRLAAYLSRKEDSPFNVQLYLKHPASVDQWEKADAILMTSSLADMYENFLDGQRVLLLDEEGKGIEDGSAGVYKYQSAAVIYQTLLEFCVDKCGKKLIGSGKNRKRFILMAIYTPIGGERVTESVLAMCRRMAKAERVLYLNMEPVPVFQMLLEGSEKKEGISDLIYYAKQHNRNMGTKLGMMTVKGDFDYLMPAATPVEIGELSIEDWQYCLESIENETDYEKVIMDFGSSVPPAAVLDACAGLKIVSGNSTWERMLIRQFRSILGRLTERDFEEIIEEAGLEKSVDAVEIQR